MGMLLEPPEIVVWGRSLGKEKERVVLYTRSACGLAAGHGCVENSFHIDVPEVSSTLNCIREGENERSGGCSSLFWIFQPASEGQGQFGLHFGESLFIEHRVRHGGAIQGNEANKRK
jgi:hypothetical protein